MKWNIRTQKVSFRVSFAWYFALILWRGWEHFYKILITIMLSDANFLQLIKRKYLMIEIRQWVCSLFYRQKSLFGSSNDQCNSYFHFDNWILSFKKYEETRHEMIIRFSSNRFNTPKLELKPVPMYFVMKWNYCKWNGRTMQVWKGMIRQFIRNVNKL